MIIFAATNDSVKFHESILNTFLNRKFNMYLDDDDDDEQDFDYEDANFDSNDDSGMGLNLQTSAQKSAATSKSKLKKKAAKPKATAKSSKKNLIELFSLYGNMDQHKRAEILAKYCQVQSGILICTVWLHFGFLQIRKFAS
jgi:hypothetical protein